jgi:anti-sigma-K factor RskA
MKTEMNIQELISSGKLELYVAGTLSEREMGDVAAYAQEYPEVASEIEKIERTMLDFLSPVEFSMGEPEKERQISQIFDKIHGPGEDSQAVVVPMHRRGRAAIAAAVAALIVAAGLSVWLGLRNKNLNEEMATLQKHQQEMLAQRDQIEDGYNKVQQEFSVMRNIVTKRVQLGTVAGNKITDSSSYMLLYWNPTTGKLMLADSHLPKIADNQEYQLWALYNGKPVDAGVFDVKNDSTGAGFQKDISNAQAFAVTVEPRGGSKTPTMSNLCMVGKL